MGWLGGTVRRWIALMGLVATVIGVATFAISAHLALAWLAIGGLLLLVVSLVLELREHHRGDPSRAVLDRAIREGREMMQRESIGGTRMLAWQNATASLLGEHLGPLAEHDFLHHAPPPEDSTEPAMQYRVRTQVAYLEELRNRR